MVNLRIGLLRAGEGKNFVGHLDQPARHGRIVDGSRELSQFQRQLLNLRIDISHCQDLT